MFNLVKYRYAFLIFSFFIIIPGLISLGVKQLNVGIDFAGGASVDLHPQRDTTTAEITNLLKPLNLNSLQVLVGTGNSTAVQAAGKTIWIRFNTQVDTTVQNTIQDDLQKHYPEVSVKFYTLTLQAKLVTMVVAENFATAPQINTIDALFAKVPELKKIPDTSDTSKGPPTVTVTPTPTAAAASPTATAKASTTPGATPTVSGPINATPTPVATGTTATNPSNIPVSVQEVVEGKSGQTVSILTSSEVKTSDVTRMMGTVLNGKGPYLQFLTNSEVSASVAQETTRNAILAVLAASVFILLYVWFSFRKIPRPWRYGACAIAALLHDVLVVLGIFSILGWLAHIQIDALFVTALLTVVGFSVHDTIVVFDRIRENSQRRTSETFEQIVNASLVQTLARSLNTSLTVILTLSALTLFSSAGNVRNFALALLVGIISGTYSSIFNASMLLVMWEKSEWIFKYFNHTPAVEGRPAKVKEVRDRELTRS